VAGTNLLREEGPIYAEGPIMTIELASRFGPTLQSLALEKQDGTWKTRWPLVCLCGLPPIEQKNARWMGHPAHRTAARSGGCATASGGYGGRRSGRTARLGAGLGARYQFFGLSVAQRRKFTRQMDVSSNCAIVSQPMMTVLTGRDRV